MAMYLILHRFCRQKIAGLCALFALVSASPQVHAELPPSAYREFQREAPEVLVINVISVDTKRSETADANVTSVAMSARVIEVNRSAAKLKPGATINVEYDVTTHRAAGWVGPSQLPILQSGARYPAYLERDAAKPAVYHPAAGGYTFQRVSE